MRNNKASKINKLSTALRILMLVVIGVTLGLNVYSWNARNVTGDQMPMPFGIGASIVLSGSMEPELSVNDLIIVQKQDKYQTGDVVVFQSGYDLVVHRIIETDGDTVVTQGDANNIADDPVKLEDVKGKVVGNIPAVGAVLRVLKTPIGIVSIIIIAVLLVELPYRKENNKNNEELNKIKEEIRKLREE